MKKFLSGEGFELQWNQYSLKLLTLRMLQLRRAAQPEEVA